MNHSSIPARSQLPTNVGLKVVGAQGRAEAEGFVRQVFAAAHDAEVTHFMPLPNPSFWNATWTGRWRLA